MFTFFRVKNFVLFCLDEINIGMMFDTCGKGVETIENGVLCTLNS